MATSSPYHVYATVLTTDADDVHEPLVKRLAIVGGATSSNMNPAGLSESDIDGNIQIARESSPYGFTSPSSITSPDSSLRSDITKVDLPDFDDRDHDSLNLTTVTLKKCKKQVLRPYIRLLLFVGWRGFGKESMNPGHVKWRLINIIYFLIVLGLMLFCHVYEAWNCSWKLDIKSDTKPPKTHKPDSTLQPYTIATDFVTMPTLLSNGTNDILRDIFRRNVLEFGHRERRESALSLNKTMPAFIIQPATNMACKHIVTTYIIPNFLHFTAYLMGFWYFRIQDNEQLYALMEKVFLQATPLQGRMVSQSNMIRRMRSFLAVGIIWVMLTLTLHVLYAIAFGVKNSYFMESYTPWVLFGFLMMGGLITGSVSLAVVVNYAAQCEMLTFFIHGIQMRLEERSVHLKYAMKDIIAVRQSLGQLNGAMSRMTSLLVITFAESIIIGISVLIMNENDTRITWAYRGLFPIVWFILFIFPLVQAARCNSACNKFTRVALETRVFGYQNSSDQELDSFLLFVTNTNLRDPI